MWLLKPCGILKKFWTLTCIHIVLPSPTNDKGLLGLRAVLIVPGRAARCVDRPFGGAQQRRLRLALAGGPFPGWKAGTHWGQESVQRSLTSSATEQKQKHTFFSWFSTVYFTNKPDYMNADLLHSPTSRPSDSNGKKTVLLLQRVIQSLQECKTWHSRGLCGLRVQDEK